MEKRLAQLQFTCNVCAKPLDINLINLEDQPMLEQKVVSDPNEDNIKSWTRIGIAAGIVACFVYPVMTLVDLPRIPQLILGGSFGPAFVIASIALAQILQVRRNKPTVKLAAIFNSLAGSLVTAMIIVQLSIIYSTVPSLDGNLNDLVRHKVWDVVLGLDVSFDIFIGLGTLFFAINLIYDKRFGKTIGWTGIFVSIVPLLGANIYYFPDPPYTHGFPHVGIFTGLWYLGVVFLMIRSARKSIIES